MSPNKSEKLHFASISDAIKYQDNEVYQKIFKENESRMLIEQLEEAIKAIKEEKIKIKIFRNKLEMDINNRQLQEFYLEKYQRNILNKRIQNLSNYQD